MNKVFFSLLAVMASLAAGAQGTSPVNSDGDRENQVYHVFTNARIYTDPDHSFRGTLVVRDGLIIEAGPNVKVPRGSIVRDLKGAFIYPAFIDPASTAGSKPVKRAHSDVPVYERKDEKGLYWNSAIEPRRNAAEENTLSGEAFDKLRNMGVAVVNTHVPDGIIRGTGTAVLTGGDDKDRFVKGKSSLFYSFEKGSSPMDYPSSQMGSIALLNQFFYDVKWYHSTTGKKEYNESLELFPTLKNLPQIFVLKDKQEILRAAKIAKEHGIPFYYAGRGDEYQRAAEISKLETGLIIPITLPGPAEVSDPFDAGLVNLSQMKHWELAPHNARILKQHRIPFSFSFEGINSGEQFRKNIIKMIRAGLSPEDALRALTVTPATMLGIEAQTGTLEPGKLANFNIVSDSLFRDKSEILETWVKGRRYVHKPVEMTDIRGTYDLNVNGKKFFVLKVEGDRWKPSAKAALKGSTDTVQVSLVNSPELLTLNIPEGKKDSLQLQKLTRLSGKINYKSGIWDGKGEDADGNWINWSAIKKQEFTEKKDTSRIKTYPAGEVLYPFSGYGAKALPDTGIILIRNVTVWTNEDTGIVKGIDVLLRDGKISQLGKGIDISKIRMPVNIIDGTGKHLTPGIIDEHSHIAISKGVNEGTQAVTSEVSIGDVVNAEDINIYRQLSGGVTAAQLLHGSANPIGGQSALIKLRWGRSGEEMKIAGAPGFIKFALGENVKQSNWGERHSIRFPQTRMGVEQVYYDAFTRAKEYIAGWENYNELSPKERTKKGITAPRVDLELEALAEILKKERFITCHSYVQSEINMLMHVADSMGFTVNTFTHILEGYKVADKMKEHGAGASTFSDWWAYKFEVNDAIPYNAAILNEMGVVTAINSDDAEMGRRLNHEAAKTMKYGGVSEQEALKMVTLNPAKLLHLDHRMGSIKTGKDADLVLWSGHPLSVYSKAEKTIIDGVIYYDREQEEKKLGYIRQERNRLVQLMLDAKKNGEKPEAPEPAKTKEYHCDTLEP